MKILRIALNNLNSLRGEHVIDMTCEPLTSAGLFAITGPTGAGKSTLLDAVTLALYGRAARYDKPNPEDMMSRHCGECSAEVLFAVPGGTYRAQWHLRRARGRADGNIQPPNRYIYDADGNVLSEKIREADERIEELIGLDYGRFLRSALLAQGEFARFLKADANERAELLESLTGTVIYSELGALAHSEAAHRQRLLEEQEKQLGQIPLLEDEQRAEIVDNITSTAAEKQHLSATIEQNAAMVQKIDSLAEALRQQAETMGKLAALENEKKETETDLQRLTAHRLTLPYGDDLVRLESAEEHLKKTAKKRQTAEKARKAAALAQTKAIAVYRTVLQNSMAAQQARLAAAQVNADQAREKAAAAQQWLTAHEKDAGLAEYLTELATSIAEFRTNRDRLADFREDLYKTTAILTSIQQHFPESFEACSREELATLLEAFEKKLENAKGEFEDQRRLAAKDLQLKRDHLQKSRLIAELETHRAELVAGEPCPLCGATAHPYAAGQEPGIPFEELETAVIGAEEMLKNRAAMVDDLAEALDALKEKRPAVLERLDEWQALKEKLSVALRDFGEPLPEPEKENDLKKALQKREKDYRKHTTEDEEAQRAIKAAAEEQTNAYAHLAEWTPQLAALGDAAPEEGAMDLDNEELPTLSQAREAWSEARSNEKSTLTELDSRQHDETAAQEERGRIREKVEAALTESVFDTLEALREARLAGDEVERLSGLENKLNDRENELKTRRSLTLEQLETLRLLGVPEGEEAAQFKTRQAELQSRRDASIESLTTWQHQLAEDARNRQQLADQQKTLEEARQEFAVWLRLQRMIGSHDGAKFRKYAQAISLDILVRHANRHLARLSDRYCIRRLEGAELQLEIEDIYQAGVRRPMASLSGGESFLTSLALALGLSELAGRKVRIESLFIDEGFGSLDADSLDLAISTLESLQQDNKCVGVISHVELLKQRITTQIMVEKQSAGISTLTIVH